MPSALLVLGVAFFFFFSCFVAYVVAFVVETKLLVHLCDRISGWARDIESAPEGTKENGKKGKRERALDERASPRKFHDKLWTGGASPLPGLQAQTLLYRPSFE